MSAYVFDANAILDYVFNGINAPTVRDILKQTGKKDVNLLISSAQVGEVYYEVARRKGADLAKETLKRLEDLGFQFSDFTPERATAAADLRLECHLAFADSAAAGLAIEQNAVVVTADKDFEKVEKRVKIQWLKGSHHD